MFFSDYNDKKYMLCLFIIYSCSQGLLLLISGRWWDDMTNVVRDVNALRETMTQAGGYPVGYWIDYIGWHISVPTVTFIGYFLSTIFVYKILKAFGVTKNSSFWIAALYAVMPFNDARITWICFPYTVTLIAFLLAVLLTIKMLHGHGICKLLMRITALLLFVGGAFHTQSFLVFFAVVLGYIVLQVGWWRSFKLYGDFWLAPIVFKIGKEVFAHPYGNYAGYNEITFGKLIKAIWLTVPACLHTVGGALENALATLNPMIIALIIIAAFIIRDIGKQEYEPQPENSCKGVLYGFIALYLGLFAYVLVRGHYYLKLTGPESRDMLVAPLGVALVLYYLPGLMRMRKTMRNMLYVVFIFLSIIHTNKIYIEYQLDEYHQQALIKLLHENKDIEKAQNIIMHMNKKGASGKVLTTRYYVLNGCATLAYGNESHLIMNDKDELYVLLEGKRFAKREYNLSGWNPEYRRIDGEAMYKNELNGKFWRLKYSELFAKESFEDMLLEDATLIYQPITQAQSDEIIAEYKRRR